MNREILIYAVIAATLPGTAEAQVRKPVNAPTAFTQCGGQALADYQVERIARPRLASDSTLEYAPTDTSGIGPAIQIVVDSTGRAIPESLYMLTPTSSVEQTQIAASLPAWRFTPAMVGGQAQCQILQTFARRRDRRDGSLTRPPNVR